MSNAPTPVTILTGFLGAGKTTYLNHLLQEKKDTRFAIIENEFGEQGIDGDLVLRPEENIVELNNGCLCCTLNDNLYDILNELHAQRERFDEILIEATGVADPTGLAEPFLVHPAIKKQFPLQGVICLVDAELIEDQLEETEEARQQVAYSDVLLINKTDLVSQEYVQQLIEHLQSLNPLANIFHGTMEAFPAVALHLKNSPLDALFHQKITEAVHKTPNFPVARPHHHHHHHHTEEIVSHTLVFDRPFDLQMLQSQLMVLFMVQSKGLYRMKGWLRVEGSEQQHLLQSVGKRFTIEASEKAAVAPHSQSVIVVIGKRLQRKGIERILKNCLSKSVGASKP